MSRVEGLEVLPVPDGRYRFQVGAGSDEWIDVYVDSDGEIGTHMQILGGYRLVMYPTVSNRFAIKVLR